MWNNHFCIALGGIFDIPFAEEVKIAKAAGFDGFFTNWNKPGCLDEPRALANELGMLYQSVHAPVRPHGRNVDARLSECR